MKARHVRPLEIGQDIPAGQEIAAIIAAASGIIRPIVLLATSAGLRASEIMGLRWADINFERSTITVSQRADRYNANWFAEVRIKRPHHSRRRCS